MSDLVRILGSLIRPRLSTGGLVVVIAVVAAVILAVDLSLPLGVAGGVPYVALVLLGMWLPSRRYILVLAGVGTALIVVGYVFSPAGGISWVVFTNRGLALFAIWMVAILLLHHKRAEKQIRGLNAELEQRVEERTAELRQANQALRDEIAERKRAESELAEKSALLEATMNNIDQGVSLVDADLNAAAFNRMFDIAEEEAEGVRATSPLTGLALTCANHDNAL